MTIPVVIAGLSMGLVSSLHCVGMCGPLVMSLPLAPKPAWQRLLATLTYHTGRLTVYGLLGWMFGLAGRRLQVAGWQQWFSIVMGIAILSWWALSKTGNMTIIPLVSAIQQKITQLNLYLWKHAGKGGFLLLGMGNGLLPCGMVYLAVAAAATTGHAGLSTLFMIAFGMGTWPALLGVGYVSASISQSLRIHLRRWAPVMTLIVGVLLILRGLNLGIPFISPIMPSIPSGGVSCH